MTGPGWRWWVRRLGVALAITGLILVLLSLALGGTP